MIRRLEGYEQIGLIGYPGDGEYIAVLGDRERQNWLLGGEFCGLNGAVLADQAAALPRYYPQGARLVLVTVRDDWIDLDERLRRGRGRPRPQLRIARSALAAGNKDSSEDERLANLEAAAMLRTSNTMTFDAGTEMAISAVATEMKLTRLEVIRLAIREWVATRESARFP